MTENTKIKAGSVVRLKSGGPQMTVKAIDTFSGEKEAICQWFKGPVILGKIESQRFSLDSLVLIKE